MPYSVSRSTDPNKRTHRSQILSCGGLGEDDDKQEVVAQQHLLFVLLLNRKDAEGTTHVPAAEVIDAAAMADTN